MAWREDLHPRDNAGRFATKGSTPAVSIQHTLANVHTASVDDLLDVFHRLTIRKGTSRRLFVLLDAELLRRDKLDKMPPPDDTPAQIQIDRMVARGYSYAEAYQDVYQTKTDRRREAGPGIERRTGENTQQARRRAYAELVALESLQAEEATRGNLLAKPCRGIDPVTLWSASPARARRCASEELKRWWDEQGGRRTFAVFAGGLEGRRVSSVASDKDFGV